MSDSGVPRSGDARANAAELSRAPLLLAIVPTIVLELELELVLDLKTDKVFISEKLQNPG
jgi:hypothetical protein